MIETKQKIMDTAVRVFAEHGYGGTSLRHIIAEAQVNLAAIHYHFGSKEELLDAVIGQKVQPVNEQRLERLGQLEARAAGKPVAVEEILEAFLAPAIPVVSKSTDFPRMMGRLIGEGLMPEVARKHFSEVAMRFTAALRRALPDLSDSEVTWRVHFMIGAMAHCLCRGPEEWRGKLAAESPEMLKELVGFLAAGFRAPSARERRDVASGEK
ncbi:MAG: TetR/AcrR family transcriptional regulator [Bryobacteraceae bacterium]